MGRIDANRMYNIVKKWEWGNSQSSQIYHDPETEKTAYHLEATYIGFLSH